MDRYLSERIRLEALCALEASYLLIKVNDITVKIMENAADITDKQIETLAKERLKS